MPDASDRPVVIAYILAGIGHKRAAEALGGALRARGHRAVHVVDMLDYMPAWLRWLYPRLYIFCVNRVPWLWAILFTTTDWPWVEWLGGPCRRWGNACLGHRFLRWLEEIQPSHLVCAHFLPPEVVGAWQSRHLPSLHVWAMVTDYRPHRWWVNAVVERYFVGLEETQAALEQIGVPADRITVSGIPVDYVFHAPQDVTVLRNAHQLAPDRLTLLITSGGYGVGPVVRLCRSLTVLSREAQARLQIVVVAGNNSALQRELLAWARGMHALVRVLGFTREMHELMAAADVVVTKPGGLTVTEAMVVGRPLLLFAPIWGQESGNAEILVRHGVARLLAQPDDCGPVIARWLESPEELAAMRAQLTTMRRTPASDIVWSHLR